MGQGKTVPYFILFLMAIYSTESYDNTRRLRNSAPGVYIKRSWYLAGRHAVRVIGWGKEKGVKYWLVTNSWSTRWGDNGLFKIIRGVNECDFESSMYTGLPLIN